MSTRLTNARDGPMLDGTKHAFLQGKHPNVRARAITHIDTLRHIAALTFDDGPHPIYTPRMLALLHRHRARATFFMVGKAAQKYHYS
jgi:peptidoglycan/xylan/chitin deacetylase (PgdA/CDA1 family)